MSKRHKRKQRREFPWPIIVFGGILLIAAVVLFANWGGGDGGGTPAIQVDQDKIEYGEVKLGTDLTFTITVTNVGDGTLRFKEQPYIEVLEGC